MTTMRHSEVLRDLAVGTYTFNVSASSDDGVRVWQSGDFEVVVTRSQTVPAPFVLVCSSEVVDGCVVSR